MFEGKLWKWEEFSVVAAAGKTKLCTFQNVEMIITDSGVSVIGGRYFNHWRPKHRQCDFVLMTEKQSILFVFEILESDYKNGCGNWSEFSWVGNYDSRLYTLSHNAGIANFQTSYESC